MEFLRKSFAWIIILLTTSCIDQKLSLSRGNYVSSDFKTDGFYYSTYYGDSKSHAIWFLYQDGTLFHCGIANEEEFKNINAFLKKEIPVRRTHKESWGLFQLIGRNIVLEGWNTSVGGGLPRYRMEGKIIDDSTFIINKFIGYEGWKAKTVSVDSAIFRFFPYTPKPDSTNAYIP